MLDQNACPSLPDRGATHLPGRRRFDHGLRRRVPDLPDGDRHGVGPAGGAQALRAHLPVRNQN